MLLALAGSFLVLSSTVLAASITGFAVAAPPFLLFRPVLVPGAMLAALIAKGMVVSGALAVRGPVLLPRLASAVRKAAGSPPDYVEEGRWWGTWRPAAQALQRKGQDVAAHKTDHVAA